MRVYVSILVNGKLAITRISPQREVLREFYETDADFITDSINAGVEQTRKLSKTMFELSRINDLSEHFDSTIHTLDTIAAGLPGHTPLACVEMDDSTFPTDRSRRNEWEIFGHTLREKP